MFNFNNEAADGFSVVVDVLLLGETSVVVLIVVVETVVVDVVVVNAANLPLTQLR